MCIAYNYRPEEVERLDANEALRLARAPFYFFLMASMTAMYIEGLVKALERLG